MQEIHYENKNPFAKSVKKVKTLKNKNEKVNRGLVKISKNNKMKMMTTRTTELVIVHHHWIQPPQPLTQSLRFPSSLMR